jgi:hypothetical protein
MKGGDILLVAPYDSQEIQVGDVVVFPDPERGHIVHRVVAVSAQGVITKGDNIPHVDDRVLTPQEILGRVQAIERQGRTLPVPRQAPASLYVLKLRQTCDRAISWLLRPGYRWLGQSGLFHGLLPGWLKPKLVHFSRAEGSEWQLWLGGLLIGKKSPRQSSWSIRRPFRLFIDAASLPGEPSGGPGENSPTP